MTKSNKLLRDFRSSCRADEIFFHRDIGWSEGSIKKLRSAEQKRIVWSHISCQFGGENAVVVWPQFEKSDFFPYCCVKHVNHLNVWQVQLLQGAFSQVPNALLPPKSRFRLLPKQVVSDDAQTFIWMISYIRWVKCKGIGGVLPQNQGELKIRCYGLFINKFPKNP